LAYLATLSIQDFVRQLKLFLKILYFLDLSRTVTEQANFLGSIGTAHRNKELESRVLTVAKNLENEIEEASGVEPSMTEIEIVDYIQYVVNEIHKNKK
jgi:hypothetical protein